METGTHIGGTGTTLNESNQHWKQAFDQNVLFNIERVEFVAFTADHQGALICFGIALNCSFSGTVDGWNYLLYHLLLFLDKRPETRALRELKPPPSPNKNNPFCPTGLPKVSIRPNILILECSFIISYVLLIVIYAAPLSPK